MRIDFYFEVGTGNTMCALLAVRYQSSKTIFWSKTMVIFRNADSRSILNNVMSGSIITLSVKVMEQEGAVRWRAVSDRWADKVFFLLFKLWSYPLASKILWSNVGFLLCFALTINPPLPSYFRWNVTVSPATLCYDSAAGLTTAAPAKEALLTVRQVM